MLRLRLFAAKRVSQLPIIFSSAGEPAEDGPAAQLRVKDCTSWFVFVQAKNGHAINNAQLQLIVYLLPVLISYFKKRKKHKEQL